ncbi:MAG: hypothetical protein J5601_01880 [Elusimicrobiaceae bacterium]|nr:hypothetical protein [Elusimicrobiaceae bacterium]
MFRLLEIGFWLCLFTTAYALPNPPTKIPSKRAISLPALEAYEKILTRNSFVKDVVRSQGPLVEPAVYLPQFQLAKNMYEKLMAPSTQLPFDIIQRNELIQAIDQLTLVNEQTRQLWKGIVKYRRAIGTREDIAQNFQDYFGFGTQEDISLLLEDPQPGEALAKGLQPKEALLKSPHLQQLQEIYQDFAERFTQFVREKGRLPQDTNEEEAILSQQYQSFRFLNPHYQFEPLKKYVLQIEQAVQSVSK